MNLRKAAASILSVFALATTLAIPAHSADSVKMTYAYFMNPVELPDGKVAPAGLYAFKLVDETPTNKIIQILTALPSGTLPPTSPVNSGAFATPAAPMSLIATIVAVPDYHNRPGNGIVTYYPARDGGNAALRTVIFAPDENALVFVYPAARAGALAKAANRPVPSMAADAADANALKGAALQVTIADGSVTEIAAAFGKPGDAFAPQPGGARGAGGGYNGAR
jgi:hypothetical protein